MGKEDSKKVNTQNCVGVHVYACMCLCVCVYVHVCIYVRVFVGVCGQHVGGPDVN